MLAQVPLLMVGVLFAVGAAAAPFSDEDASWPGPPSTTARAPRTTESTTKSTTTSTSTTTTSSTTTSTSTTTTTRLPSTTTAAVRTTIAAPMTTAARSPATTATPAPTVAPTGDCHSSYAGACVPAGVSDVDCGGGSGNGPAYVYAKGFQVVGPDVYGLDADNDDIACES